MEHLTRLSASKSTARLAFVHFLRTGDCLPEDAFAEPTPIEAKFNPYHDPSNGQFTFGPGGTGSSGPFDSARSVTRGTTTPSSDTSAYLAHIVSDGVYRPSDDGNLLFQQTGGAEPPIGIGDNSGA